MVEELTRSPLALVGRLDDEEEVEVEEEVLCDEFVDAVATDGVEPDEPEENEN